MITFEQVSFGYADGPPVLNGINLNIPEGDLCLVVGRTGTGKSTLLGAVNGLVPHFTGGTLTGRVTVGGRSTAQHRPRDLAELVGYVGQDPVAGFVTDTVVDEVAYGMEQLGVSASAMRKRVEETLDLMGIADLRRRPLASLSGGQQQRVAIAAVLASQPRVLVLDEPTSALDPTAALDVLGAITTLVHDVGLTVLLAEHRLERVMHAADSVLWLRGDGTAELGEPARVLARCDVVPPLSALAHALGWSEVPLSVREARRRVQRERVEITPPVPYRSPSEPVAVEVSDLTVGYGPVNALDRVSLRIGQGCVTALMGRNGAGKSSLLWALQGGIASTGTLMVDGVEPRQLTAAQARRHVTLVPQTAADLLYLPTVADECAQADRESDAAPGTTLGILVRLGADLPPEADPRDLSEGQRLLLVLAIQLAAEPAVVLLDEPTRGLDYELKRRLTAITGQLSAAGKTVIISTHDVEFAAMATHRIIVLGDGEVVADGETHEICMSSPVWAPQTAKVFAPVPVLTPDEIGRGLR